jgi:hypothetical protein
MWDNIVGRNIARCNRNLLWTNVVILSLLLFWAYSQQRYLYNCFTGPSPISQEQLTKIGNPEGLQRYFVSIDQLKPFETGLQTIERTKDKYTNEVKNERVTASYFAAPIQKKLLLIKSPHATASASYEGALQPVPDNVRSYFQREVLDKRQRKFEDVFLPYFVDATSFRANAYIGLAFGIPLGLLAAYNIVKALTRINNIEASPIYKWLQHYDQPPAATGQMIDQDLKASGNSSTLRPFILTSSWLLHKTIFNFKITQLSEIVWVYQKVTRHSVNFIPTGKTYGVIVADKFGRKIEVDAGRGAQQHVANFMTALVNRIPWVIAGYSDQLRNEYRKNRAALVAAVDARRVQYSRQANA